MNYLRFIVLLISSAYTYSSLVNTTENQTSLDAPPADQLASFRKITVNLSSSDKNLLAKIIRKVIKKESIKDETTQAFERENSDALADAIGDIAAINASIKDNNFEPLLDLYEILKPGYSKFLREKLIAADKKLKKEDSPTHFIRHFAQLNDFEILGVPKEGYTARQVKEAFNKLSLELHPDKNINNPESAKAAFSLLKDARDRLLAKLTPSSSPAPTPSPEPAP